MVREFAARCDNYVFARSAASSRAFTALALSFKYCTARSKPLRWCENIFSALDTTVGDIIQEGIEYLEE